MNQLSLLVGSLTALGGVPPASALTLSRSDAVARATVGAADLAQLRRAHAVAAGALRDVPYSTNPVLSVESEGASSPFSAREYSRRVTLEQEIDLRGERSARRRVGGAAIAVSVADVGARQQEIAADVDEAVGRWLVAGRRVELLSELTSRARRVQESAEAARRRETVTAFAARLLRADALSLQAEQVEAAREQGQVEAELRILLTVPPSDSLRFINDLSDSAWHCPLDTALALARSARFDLRRSAAAESLAGERLRLERRLRRVNPTLTASLGRDRMFIESVPVSGGAIAGPIESSTTTIGLRASVPLPLSQRNQVAVSEATLELERTRAERAAREREVAREVAAACASLQGAEERRAILQSLTSGVAGDLELTMAAYRGGRIALEEYLAVSGRLLRFDRDLLDATALVETARAALVRATGLTRETLATHLLTTR